jgi:hypothetical protein
MTEIFNPFANYGQIVYGDRFIGREDALRRINSRIISPKKPANLAIIGEPRIGKSSLAYQGIMERSGELLARGLIPVWINLGCFSCSRDFFLAMAGNVARQACLRHDENFVRMFQSIASEIDPLEFKLSIDDFFRAVHREGYSVVFVLDEFDHSRVLFHGEPAAFQSLRDLSYHPDFGVAYCTTSRRSIEEIELQSVAISTFSGTCQQFFLSNFTDQDTETVFIRLAELNCNLVPEFKAGVLDHAGSHPFLLDIVAYWILQAKIDKDRAIDLEELIDMTRDDFLSVYNHIIDLLKADGRLVRLLKITFGPSHDVTSGWIDDFLKAGLLVRTATGAVQPFSSTFQRYLEILDRELPDGDELWSIWRRTEKKLRGIIQFVFQKKQGETWVEDLSRSQIKIKSIFERCESCRADEQLKFKGRASSNLLDFAYPSDLFELIFIEWRSFSDLFGKDKVYWGQRQAVLCKLRNPMAHVRDEILLDWERQIAEGYCREILSLELS